MIKKTYIKQISQAIDFEDALQEVFVSLKPFCDKAFKLTAFVHAQQADDYKNKHRQLAAAMQSCFGKDCPTWSMISEAPKDAALCIVLQVSDAPKKHVDFHGLPIVILEQNTEKELWASGLSSLHEDMKISANAVFEQLLGVLSEAGFEFDDLVRQWNYIGEILKMQTKDGVCSQNYQVFNDIRNDFYQRYKRTSDFPAATGIGMKTQGVIVDIFARKSGVQEQSLPLRSKVQKNPFAYNDAVLVGDKTDKKPPLFERARMLWDGCQAQIFVSGTASIKNQETIAIGDVGAQTENTIQFIKELVSSKNIRDNYPHIHAERCIYHRVRVYVKRRDDFETVYKICAAHFPEHVINMVEADVCRDNLLVEIEADLIIK